MAVESAPGVKQIQMMLTISHAMDAKPPSMQFAAKKDHMEVKRSSMASIKPRSAIIYLYVMFASRNGKTMKLVV